MRRSVIFALLACLACADARAQEAKITVNVDGDGPYWVGQEISIAVIVYAPGYFDSKVNFDLPDPEGVLLMPPTDNPVVGNETIDDTLYVTQWHTFRAWAMRSGEQTIPAIPARFQYKSTPMAEDSQSASVTSTPVPLKVDSPPGTEDMGTVISASGLTVEEEWKPALDGGEIKAGDAYTRTITFSAPEVPGMIFPPFPAADIDGLGVYSKPQVADETDSRGNLVGKRVDVITYVAKKPGQYTIPAAQFRWFDTGAKAVRTQQFDARTLTVIPNPDMASAVGPDATQGESAGQSRFRDWRDWIPGVAVALFLGLLFTSRAVRRSLGRALQVFRPRHLDPLYPGDG